MPLNSDGSAAGSDGTCVTVEDVLNFKIRGCDASDTICATPEEIERYIEEAIILIQAITNTIFCPVDTCYDFDGTGDFQLYFQKTTSQRLLTLDTITEIGCNGCDLPVETASNYGHYLQYDCKSKFPCGQSNIRVCGTWGAYAEIPPTIKSAVIYLVLERIEPGITGLDTNMNQIDSIVWSDLSINYRTTGVDYADVSTRIPFVDQMLVAFTPTASQITFMAVGDTDNCNQRCCGRLLSPGESSCVSCKEEHCSE